MAPLLSAFKWIDAPGSIPFLAICVAFGLVLAFVWPRRRRLTVAWFGTALGTYFILAIPVVANGIAEALPRLEAPALSADNKIRTLVVFDGDNRRGRVREAQRLYDLARPEAVWSLGREPWMEPALKAAGIPGDRVRHDLSTTTTLEQIEWVRRWMVDHGGEMSVAIVASRLQSPRVDALLRAGGVRALLAPSPIDVEPATTGARRFVPTYYALRISRDALYEHIALPYYRYHGWIE